MSNAELTNAAAPLVLRDKDGEVEYQAVAFTDKDFNTLDRWIQSEVVSIARSSLQAQLEENEVSLQQYEEEMSIASRASLGVSIYTPQGVAVTNTPRGLARIAWMMCSKNHPKLKHADFIPLCRNVENRLEIIRVYKMLNPGDVDGGSDDAEDGDSQGNA